MSLGLARDSILNLVDYERRYADDDEEGEEKLQEPSMINGQQPPESSTDDDFFLLDGDDDDGATQHFPEGSSIIHPSWEQQTVPSDNTNQQNVDHFSYFQDSISKNLGRDHSLSDTEVQENSMKANENARLRGYSVSDPSGVVFDNSQGGIGRVGRNVGYNYDYSNYIDYYGHNGVTYHDIGGRKAGGGVQNMFCCLLTPFISLKNKSNEITDLDDDHDDEIANDSAANMDNVQTYGKRELQPNLVTNGSHVPPPVGNGDNNSNKPVVLIAKSSNSTDTTTMTASQLTEKEEDEEDNDSRNESSTPESTPRRTTLRGTSTNHTHGTHTGAHDDEDDDFQDASEFHPEDEPHHPNKKRFLNDEVIKKSRETGMSAEQLLEELGFQEEKKGEDTFEDNGEDDEDEDDISDATDAYGEKLTDKDRVAVLARLRATPNLSLPNPNAADNTNDPHDMQIPAETSDGGRTLEDEAVAARLAAEEVNGSVKGLRTLPTPKDQLSPELHQAQVVQEEKVFMKGILKRTSFHKTPSVVGNPLKPEKTESGSRRSLFPQYNTSAAEAENSTPEESEKNVSFAPMARVVTVTSRNDMSFVQRSTIWWQRTDYEDFKKTGRIIAKAMLEGGSQIWLTSNNAWGKRQQAQIRSSHTSFSSDENNDETSDEDAYNRALSRYAGRQFQVPGEEPMQDDFSDKWWCKFGHSRRGLEHIASIEEGRQRQANVATALKAILDEQRRQRMSHLRDNRKLANIAMQYTSWARDLALAAGAADAEAVRSNFGRDAKTRAHYLQRGIQSSGRNVAQSIASGRLPNASPPTILPAQLLDANTSSTMMMKKPGRTRQNSTLGSMAGSTTEPETTEMKSHSETKEGTETTSESAPPGTPLSRKARGFGTDENTNMSAVLTGLGALPPHRVGVC